jgi:hypothetical protein
MGPVFWPFNQMGMDGIHANVHHFASIVICITYRFLVKAGLPEEHSAVLATVDFMGAAALNELHDLFERMILSGRKQ